MIPSARPPTTTFEASVPANPAVLSAFRHSLRDWLRAAKLDQGAQAALVLAVHEAVANGIEHASGSPVHVRASMDNGELVVEVTTRGTWGASRGGGDAWAERGRGLPLMRGLTELELQVAGDCATIRLRPRHA